jgi:hypothetical protein
MYFALPRVRRETAGMFVIPLGFIPCVIYFCLNDLSDPFVRRSSRFLAWIHEDVVAGCGCSTMSGYTGSQTTS